MKIIFISLFEMLSLRDLRLFENKIVELFKKCKWSFFLKIFNLNDNFLEILFKSMVSVKLLILYIVRNNLYEVFLCICAIIILGLLDLLGNFRLI